jgi:type 1 glutamine amidotransferase
MMLTPAFASSILASLTLLLVAPAFGGDNSGVKHVLFFSKASSWEQKIVHRDGDQLSFLEKAAQKLGMDNQIDFTFSKDGTIFTPENLAKFDAFFFFTSGDMTFEERTGRGDNYPLMTLAGKKAFLDAIHDGKGFIGCNTAVYTFTGAVSPGEAKEPANASRYTRMIGGGYIGHNEVQKGHFSHLDLKFPGMEKVPPDYCPVDQWYAFRNLMPDLHVIMALNSAELTGNLYERPNYPIAWARMEGKGRVFYTTMGHTAEIWSDPVFLQMLLGGIRWATRTVDAEITPDIDKITPRANEIPPPARKFVPSHPPQVNPHFPNFKVWLDQEYQTDAPKRVLFFTKSAGYENPIVYRDTAWPSPLEARMLEFGQKNHIDFVFSKDGTIFSSEDLTKYDAFLFYTTGDLTTQPRNGTGDNYPLMTAKGKDALLEAIRNGKGFIGIHNAIDAFGRVASSNDSIDASQADPCARMLGAQSAGHGSERKRSLIPTDSAFPGMQHVPTEFAPLEVWCAFNRFQPDLHLILSHDRGKMAGNSNPPAAYPVAWARMEGKGRVYYTSLGSGEETWKSPAFQQMLLGALRWTSGMENADIAPNAGAATLHTFEIPIPDAR